MLHSALQVIDLEFLAALGHQLMLIQARVIPDRMLFTLMEMIQGEATFVRGRHYSAIPANTVR